MDFTTLEALFFFFLGHIQPQLISMCFQKLIRFTCYESFLWCKIEAYISIAIYDILPDFAPKEVGVLNEFGKTPNKLCSPIIFGASQQPFTLIEEIDKLNPTTL